MDQPRAYLTWPTIFYPLPDSQPASLPPPVDQHSLRAPFAINNSLFNAALRPEVPTVFASLYVATVFLLNKYNRERNYRPWPVSQTTAFKFFIIAHNVALTLYSLLTFIAMSRAIAHVWPGWSNPYGAAGVADSLCKIHGPRGLGDAATFNSTINIWEIKNTLLKLGSDATPDSTDVGRLWNEGLAFWGWFFYISKFYEVIDTLIILAKGKRSATLQTYHHAGAMLCMWAGIRFMSPPIWMFVFINSAIHAMMYTYFTLSALAFQVPQTLKRSLTSLQIAQFVFGASYAAAHLFVQYDIPISTPYNVVSTVERVVSSASSVASAATLTASQLVEPSSSAVAVASLLKKLLLRAADHEGVAEQIAMPQGSSYVAPVPKVQQKIERFMEERLETKWHSDWSRVNCIDTRGEAFAIYLNLLYLAPLTWLFLRFFFRAYSQRSGARSAVHDATVNTQNAVEARGRRAEDALDRRVSQVEQKSEDFYEQLRRDVSDIKRGKFQAPRVSERVQSFEGKLKTAAESAADRIRSMAAGGDAHTKHDDSAIDDESALEPNEEPPRVEGETPETTILVRDEAPAHIDKPAPAPATPPTQPSQPAQAVPEADAQQEPPLSVPTSPEPTSGKTKMKKSKSSRPTSPPPVADPAPPAVAALNAEHDAQLAATQPVRPGTQAPTPPADPADPDPAPAPAADVDPLAQSASIIEHEPERPTATNGARAPE